MAKKDIYQNALDAIKENDKKKKQNKTATSSVSQNDRDYIKKIADHALYKIRANETANRPERLNLIAGNINNDLYKPGSSKAMQGYAGALEHEKAKSLEASNFYVLNPDYYGDQTKQYENAELEAQKFADATSKIVQARYGNPSVLNGLDPKSDEYEQYKGLLNLAGYEVFTAQQQNQPKKELLIPDVEIPENYDFKSFGDDIYVAKYGELKDGTKLTENERLAVKRRVEAVAGIEDFDALSSSEQMSLTMDEDYLSELKLLSSQNRTQEEDVQLAEQFRDNDIRDDLQTIADWKEGYLPVSEDAVNRAKNRILAATGINVDQVPDSVDLGDGYTVSGVDYLTYMMDRAGNDIAAAGQTSKAELWKQDIYDKYSGLADRPDFYEKSQYIEPAENDGWGDVYNLASGVLNEQQMQQARDRLKGNPGDWYSRMAGFDELGFEYMTPGQREKFRYLYNSGDINGAMQYLQDLSWDLNRQRQEKMVAEQEKFADERPVLASAASVAQGIENEVRGVYNLGREASGFDINEYDTSFDAGLKQNITRSIVGQNIAEATDGVELFGRNIAQMGYNAVMSATDSTVNAFLFGKGASPMMGAGAFNTSYQQKLEEGLSNQDAFIDALAEGAIEIGTEYFSIEALMKDSTSPLGYFLRNLITEPSEEMVGFTVNKIYDEIMYGMDSQTNARIRELRLKGYSPEDAKAQATREMLADLFETGFTAFLSGGVAAAGGTIRTAAENQTSGKNIQSHGDEAVKAVLDLANTMHFDEDVQSLIDDQMAALNMSNEETTPAQSIPSVDNMRTVQDEETRTKLKEKLIEEKTLDPKKVAKKVAKKEKADEKADQIVRSKGGVLSPAKIGRIFRETMKAVDENSKQVISNTAARYVAGELQKNGVDDPAITDAVVRIVSDNGKPQDYDLVVKNDGALAVVRSMTDTIEYGRNLSRKAAHIAEMAAKKNKNTTTEETTATTEETTEVVPEVVGEADELTEEEMAAADIPTDAETISAMIRNEVQDLGEQNAESVVSAYQEGQDPVSYATQFKRAMQFGEEGRNLDVIKKSDTLSQLTDYQKTKAYTMGRGMRVARAEEAAKNRKGLVKVGNIDTSAIRNVKLNNFQKQGVESISRLAQAAGFNVKFTARSYDENGNATSKKNGVWIPSTRTIEIDINAGRISKASTNYAMMQTAGHELTHFIKEFADADLWNQYQDFVLGHLSEKMSEADLDTKIEDVINRWKAQGQTLDRDGAMEEIIAESSGDALLKLTEADIQQMAEQNPSLLKKIGEFIRKWVGEVKTLIEEAYKGQKVRNQFAEQMVDSLDELGAKWTELLKDAAQHARAVKGENITVDAQGEVKFSLQENERLMQNATVMNDGKGNVPTGVLEKAAAARGKVAAFMRDDSRNLNLPEDLMGNTFFSDAAYGGTEENTTVCPRSIGADAFLDAVSDKIGRPLTVAEQVRISQDVIGAADIKEPQCIYCYVAADRAAYREFLGKYIDQRDGVIEALKNGENDLKKLYETFLNGRKDTPNMKKRFNLWVESYQQGKRLLSSGDLANIGVLTAIQSDKYRQLSSDPNFAAQMKDALAYAQSASWAKKRVNYVAYNGHILKWGQNRINKLNSMYGLRMYSFSDFSPAFALENMQMVTDASVRGLKMLAYTKVPAFAEIFADTGMNINVSVFATEVQGDNGSSIVENNLMGADWKAAQKLRSEHENVGITFVATSDAQVEWALAQDWIDVCIPYHLVRTGRTIAEIMKYKNFTAESGDTKKAGWSKAAGNLSSIPAALHNNDRDTYMRLLEENNLEPRFARFVDNPNYMKLVNETRQSVTTSKPVQPIFNTDAAINALQDMANNGGYYVPIGGSEQRMYELADEFAGKVQAGEYQTDLVEEDVKFSVEEDNPFSYDTLVEKPDMAVVNLIPQPIADRDDAVDKGTANVKKYATRVDSHGTPMMYIPDLGKYVSVGRKAMAHGLDGKRISKQAPVIVQIGDVLHNSIVVNEAVPKKDGVKRSWIMLGVANDWDGTPVYVRSVVNQSTGHVEEVAAFYAALGKKNRASRNVSAERVGDNSLKPSSNSVISVAEMLKNVKGAFDDVISEDVARHLGIERGTSEFTERLMYQLQDPTQITDREILANVMESAAENQAELDFVRRYRKRIASLNEKQAELEETNAAIVNARKAGKRADAAALQNKADILAKQIAREDGMLLKFEAGKPLQAVVQRERAALKRKADERVKAYAAKRVETVKKQEAEKREKLNQTLAEVREKRDQKLAALRQEKQDAVRKVREEKDESFGKAKYRKRIEEDVAKLRTWVTTPTNKEHVPQFLRGPLGDMINALDFSSARSLNGGEVTQKDTKLMAALDAMNAALSKLREQQTGLDNGASAFATIIDLPYGYLEDFTAMVAEIKNTLNATQAAGDIPINRMTAKQLQALSQSIRTLTTSIRQMNRLLANAKYESAVSAANSTIDELGKMTAKKDTFKAVAGISKFMDWTNTVPYYAFKRFGKGGQAIFDGLMNGWDKLAFNSDELVKFANAAYTTKEVRQWSKEVQRVELSNGETVRMTTAQLMSLYCLSKRAQAVGHLLGGGIRIADIESKGKNIVQSENYTLTERDLDTFSEMLTERQRQVADKLQNFMSTKGAEWGNEVSMKRFGYEMFTERFYFPIETDANNRIAIDEQAQENSLFRLLNMSATKGLVKGANNALVVRDIFDVFTAHSSDMAKYNALGLQILDALKWLNYVEKTQNDDGTLVTRSVQKSLERAYGTDARKYILNLLRDLNGVREGGRNDGMVNKVISNAKIASVAGNVRVWLLQATSMPRAAYAINPKYLAVGYAKMHAHPLKGMRLAEDKVGIAKWKSMGFYDTNISGNIREMVKHDQSIPAKVREKSMAPAGFMDGLTMGVIYYAAEAEVAEKYRNTPKGSDTWNKLVNDRVREIVYQTQVVDSTMTRSDAMRGKGIITLATSFMSEPTLTMNMLADSVYEARMNRRAGESIKAPTVKMVKALSVFTFTAVLTAAVEALFDAERDDDEYETFGEKYMSSFIGDLTEEDTAWEKATKVLFSNVGSNLNILNNIPFASDAMGLLQGYDNSPMYSAFVDSFKSGYDAYQRWLEGKGTWYSWVYSGLKGVSQFTGLPISNVAREGISVWNTFIADWAKKPRIQTYADNRKDAATAYYDAINAGDTERAGFVMERARINGMPEDKIAENISTYVKEDYISGDITEAIARKYLAAHGGKDSEQIDTNIKEWTYERETGFKYDKMRQDYIDGNISKAQMQTLLAQYRGMDSEEIYWKLSSWDYAKTHDGDDGGKYSWFIDAVDSGSGYQRYADELLAHGVEKGDIASQITKTFKPRYIEVYGTAEGDRLREYLLDVYEYIGYDRDYEWKRYMSKWMDD